MISIICICAMVSSSTRSLGLRSSSNSRSSFAARSLVRFLERKGVPGTTSSRFRKMLSAMVRCGSGLSSWWIIEMPAAMASAGPLTE